MKPPIQNYFSSITWRVNRARNANGVFQQIK